MGLEKKSGTHELKKHAATIHCSNPLSLLQRKISNALLYHAYKELRLKEEHEISIKQLCNLIGYQGNNHAVIRDALRSLISTVIEWNIIDDTTGVEDWTASSILASVSLQGPLCYFAYSPRMKQLLHSPSMFGKIDLFIQSKFKSSYGLALYENCIRYRGLPVTKWFEIDLFRKLMGVPEGNYTIFRDFKRRVLDKSVQEVNTYSDLIVEAEAQKEGRQVVKIRFLLKERAKKTRLGATDETTSDLFVKLVTQFNVSHDQAKQILQEYDRNFILEKITLIEESKNYQKGRVHNLAAYLLSALRNNYQAETSSTVVVTKQKATLMQKEEQQKALEKTVEQIREAYLAYRMELVDSVLESLASAERQLFMEGFFEYASLSIETILRLQRGKYTRDTVINSPQIKGLLRQYALKELQPLQQQLISFSAFIETLPDTYRSAWYQLHDHQVAKLTESLES